MGYNVDMTQSWRKRGWKLRHILRKDKHMLRKIIAARKRGESFVSIALMIYQQTGISIDPSQVREWILKYREEQNAGKNHPSTERDR